MTSKPPPSLSKTFRHPAFTYFHFRLTTFAPNQHPLAISKSTKQPDLDEITALAYLQSALNQSLGLTGTAIPIDILKIEKQDIWIRVPYDDGNALMAAVSTWSDTAKGVSLRIMGHAAWLGALVGRSSVEGKLWRLDE